jgi:hypothetical protein
MPTKGNINKELYLYLNRRAKTQHIGQSTMRAWASELGGIYPKRKPGEYRDMDNIQAYHDELDARKKGWVAAIKQDQKRIKRR